MGAHRHVGLSMMRAHAGSGRLGLLLVGELDVSTVGVLEDELTRQESPPSFIDLSQLHFLDLTGLRALLRAVESDVADSARLVGATGVVRRLIELAQRIDGPAHPPAPSLPTPALATEPGRRRPGRGKPAAHGARPAPRSGNADVARSAATADRR